MRALRLRDDTSLAQGPQLADGNQPLNWGPLDSQSLRAPRDHKAMAEKKVEFMTPSDSSCGKRLVCRWGLGEAVEQGRLSCKVIKMINCYK